MASISKSWRDIQKDSDTSFWAFAFALLLQVLGLCVLLFLAGLILAFILNY